MNARKATNAPSMRTPWRARNQWSERNGTMGNALSTSGAEGRAEPRTQYLRHFHFGWLG
jgi:hypothetical protein